jgi:hypothetical protein
MSKPVNELNATPAPDAPQVKADWTVLPVALLAEDKARLVALGTKKGIRPSPLARMWLLERMEREAA